MSLIESYTWQVGRESYSYFTVVAPSIEAALAVAQQRQNGRTEAEGARINEIKQTGKVVLNND